MRTKIEQESNVLQFSNYLYWQNWGTPLQHIVRQLFYSKLAALLFKENCLYYDLVYVTELITFRLISEGFSQNINSQNVNSQNVNFRNVNSRNVNSQNVNSQNVNFPKCQLPKCELPTVCHSGTATPDLKLRTMQPFEFQVILTDLQIQFEWKINVNGCVWCNAQ